MTYDVVLNFTPNSFGQNIKVDPHDGVFVIGRSRACNLRVNNQLVSAHHCEVRVSAEGVFVTGLSETNPVIVVRWNSGKRHNVQHRTKRLSDQDLVYLVLKESKPELDIYFVASITENPTEAMPENGSTTMSKSDSADRRERIEEVVKSVVEPPGPTQTIGQVVGKAESVFQAYCRMRREEKANNGVVLPEWKNLTAEQRADFCKKHREQSLKMCSNSNSATSGTSGNDVEKPGTSTVSSEKPNSRNSTPPTFPIETLSNISLIQNDSQSAEVLNLVSPVVAPSATLVDEAGSSKANDGSTVNKVIPAAVETTEDEEEVFEHLQCAICVDIIHDCVSLQPCLHNFCAGCFSDWRKKSNICPQCREPVTRLSRNHTVNNVISAVLKLHPNRKRSLEELHELDAKNTIDLNDLNLDQTFKNGSRPAKRRRVPEIVNLSNGPQNASTSNSGFVITISEELDRPTPTISHNTSVIDLVSDTEEEPEVQVFGLRMGTQTRETESVQMEAPLRSQDCPECDSTRGTSSESNTHWRRCDPTTVHVSCFHCLAKIPDRRLDMAIDGLPSIQCFICDKFFCSLYFGQEARCKELKLLKDYKDDDLDSRLVAGAKIVNGNLYESEILLNNLSRNGINGSQFWNTCIQQLSDGQFRPSLKPGVSGNSAVCRRCFETCFFELAYEYRRLIPPDELPETIYIIRIKTLNERGAGTDANIFVQMVGRNGKKTYTIRCQDVSGSHFERGKVDIFRIKTPCISDIAKVRIWHDNTAKHASWGCAGIQIDDTAMKRRYHFHGKFWLSTSIADCQLSREIPCTGRSFLLHLYPQCQRDTDSESSARSQSDTLESD